MDHVGIDVHKQNSQICVLGRDGEQIERRSLTERAQLRAFFGGRRPARIVIEASWLILRGKRTDTAALRLWGERIAMRRGRRTAAVAIARRLARILYAMWRDERPYTAGSGPASQRA